MLLLGFVSAVALGANEPPGPGATRNTTLAAAGAITSLTPSSLTVHGAFDVTCKLTSRSPVTAGFGVGQRVKVACPGGLLAKIRRIGPPAGTPTATAGAESAPAPGTTSSGAGAITALGASAITVTGDRTLTCAIGSGSPSTGDFHLGDAVKIGCVNGALHYIARAGISTTASTTTIPAKTDATSSYGLGSIGSLSPTTIAVTGDRPLSCELTSASPALAAFQVGDHVKIACRNLVLVAIALADGTAAATTTTTTTPSTTTATASQNSYGVGTITALSSTSVTVTGDRDATCAIAPGGPSPVDYHLGVGGQVTIACTNGVLAHVSTA